MVCATMRLVMLLCVYGATLGARAAFAQGNDLYGPAGGRAALMGNTGVALARDGAAPLYNPATIVRIRDQRLAFSANFYSFALTSYQDWHAPAAIDAAQFGGGRLDDTSLGVSTFRTLPSSLCLFFTLEELAQLSSLADDPTSTRAEGGARRKLAVCFASTENEDVDLQAIRFHGETEAGSTSQVQSLQRRWNRVYIGPTYSTYVNDDLALGAGVQVVYSYSSFGIGGSSLSERLDGGGLATSLSTNGSGRSFALTAVFGATYRYRGLTFGATARAPAFHLFGSYEGTASSTAMGSGADSSVVADAEGGFRTAAPIRIALGAGLARGGLRLELDAALNLPVQNALHAELDVTTNTLGPDGLSRRSSSEEFVVASHVVVNPSFGAEYFLSSGLSLLGGVSANFSSLAELTPTHSVGNLVQARTHHVSASLGLGSYWDGGELLFGFQFDYGWGQAIAINPYAVPNAWTVVGTGAYSLTFVISGATSLRALVGVVDKLTGNDVD